VADSPSQFFLGFMAYNRLWFNKDLRNAVFTASPGDPYTAWDASVTFDYMPSQFITFRCSSSSDFRDFSVSL
jgi:hypothetical protein